MTGPISDGTLSLLTDSSMSATTSSTSAQTSLNASKYQSIPHGHLRVNDSDVVDDDDDMYSLKHRVPLGATGHFRYLSVGIDWIADENSQGTMLIGMPSIMETFPQMIDGFEFHPLDPESSLPVLTSNHVDKGFPQSAIMKLHNIVHKQWIYRNSVLLYRGKDGLTTPDHHEIMNQVEAHSLTDPNSLLPRHSSLMDADFVSLGSSPTVDRLTWLANMNSAIAVSNLS
jgi:hypothetical protein